MSPPGIFSWEILIFLELYMATATQQGFYFYPSLYVNGMVPSKASNTTLSISAGRVRDNTNSYDIIINTTKTINTAHTGLNGLDTGVLEASKVYYIWAVASTLSVGVPGYLLSLSTSAPVMPAYYDAKILVGVWITNGSTQFITARSIGTSSRREFVLDQDIQVLDNGTSTSLSAIALALVPAFDNTIVTLDVEFTPATAGHKVSFTPFGSTATVMAEVVGNVASQISSGQLRVVSSLNSGVPSVLYINSASSGNTDVMLRAFEYYV